MPLALLFVACAGSPESTLVPSSSTPSDPRAVLISGEQAIERVVEFADAPELTNDLTVHGPIDGAFIRSYEVSGRRLLAHVNANDGTISSLLLLSVVHPGPPTVDADVAVTVAQEFLADRDVPFDGLEQTVRLHDHGETSEYVVEWQGHAGDVLVPNRREVGIDRASGQVFRYNSLNRPYSAPPPPQVDRATAEAIAVHAGNGSQLARIDRSELEIIFTVENIQRLIWRVSVTEGIAHWIVEVDAITGDATVTARG